MSWRDGEQRPRNGSASAAWTERLLLVGMYFAGAAFWGDFLRWGRMTFTTFDWPKERLYLQVVRDALVAKQIPWHVSIPPEYEVFSQFANGGEQAPCRFFAIPETILSPQLLLLHWLSPGAFVLAHLLLLYTVGFVGLLGFRKRYRLSPLPFGVLVALFSTNGFITSHIAVGHLMFGGYFFLPFFVRFLFEWTDDIRAIGPGMKLAVVFFLMLLQGALHMVVSCWILLGLLAAFQRSGFRTAAWAIGFGALLASVRLAPATVAYWDFKRLSFEGGYPTVTTLVEALAVVREATPKPPGMLGWWEYDLHVGLLGVLFVVIWGIFRRATFPELRFASLDLPLLALSILAFGDFFLPVFRLPLPFVNSERVTSRFMILPFLALTFIAVVRLQRDLTASALGPRGKLFALAGVALLCRDALAHSARWYLGTIEAQPQAQWHRLASAPIVEALDPIYRFAGLAGALATLLGCGILLSAVVRHAHKSLPVPTA